VAGRQRPLVTAEHERLGAELRVARSGASLTQVELARKLGKPQSFVAKVEGGERRLEVLEFAHYVRVIGLEPAEFLARFLSTGG